MPILDIPKEEIEASKNNLYPEGNYILLIDSVEEVISKNNGNEFISLHCKILESDSGNVEGQQISIPLFIYSENETAKKIAYGIVGFIQEAIDQVGVMDTDEWLDIPFKVDVSHRNGYHRFSNFESVDVGAPVTAAKNNSTRRERTSRRTRG